MTATFLWVLSVSVLKATVFLPLRLFGCRQSSGLPSSNIVYHEKWIPGKETIIWITPSLLLALSDPLPDLISLVFLSRFGIYSAYSTERNGGCTFKWFSVAKSAVLHLAFCILVKATADGGLCGPAEIVFPWKIIFRLVCTRESICFGWWDNTFAFVFVLFFTVRSSHSLTVGI